MEWTDIVDSARGVISLWQGKEDITVRVLERTQGRYEVQDVEFGKVYRWCPERVMVECDCGERLTLTASRSACGADYPAFVREELAILRHPGDEAAHPWRSWGSSEDTGIYFSGREAFERRMVRKWPPTSC